MSIEAILSRIKGDAEDHKEALIETANDEAKGIIESAEAEARAIREQSAARVTRDSLALLDKKISLAEAEARRMRLAAKQRMIDAALETAMEELAGMKKAEYVKFLTGRIMETGIAEGELLLNERDRKAIGGSLTKAANKALGGGKLKLSDECIQSRGGFVLRYEGAEINAKVETMVLAVKDEITQELTKVLFQE